MLNVRFLFLQYGILAVIDAKRKPAAMHCRVNSCITLLNIKPLMMKLSHQEVSRALEAALQSIEKNGIYQHFLPEVGCLSISDVCLSTEKLHI